jgi:hypothetical protein
MAVSTVLLVLLVTSAAAYAVGKGAKVDQASLEAGSAALTAPPVAPAIASGAQNEEGSGFHKGLGPNIPVPGWAKGDRAIHFLPTARGRQSDGPTSGATLPGYSDSADSDPYDPPLIYHGGTVQYNPHLYVVFWGKSWNEEPNSALRKKVTELYEKLSDSAYQRILNQYKVGPTVVVTPWTETNEPPPLRTGTARHRQ